MQHMCTNLAADACEWHISLFQLQAVHHQAVWVKGSIVRPMHHPACQQLKTKYVCRQAQMWRLVDRASGALWPQAPPSWWYRKTRRGL